MSNPIPTRAIPRQATSAVAHIAPPPSPDDPLLAFAPYLHAQPRSNSITPERQRKFVSTLAATGVVSTAARSIGKSMEALYKLRARPGAEGFAAAWDAAAMRGVQRLEDIAVERAAIGTRTPIVSGGEILGFWDKPDNALLRFLLRNRLPEKYATPGGGLPGRNGGCQAQGAKQPMTRDEAIAADKRADEFLAEFDARLDLMRERELTMKWHRRRADRLAAHAARLADMAEMPAALRGAQVVSMPAGCLG